MARESNIDNEDLEQFLFNPAKVTVSGTVEKIKRWMSVTPKDLQVSLLQNAVQQEIEEGVVWSRRQAVAIFCACAVVYGKSGALANGEQKWEAIFNDLIDVICSGDENEIRGELREKDRYSIEKYVERWHSKGFFQKCEQWHVELARCKKLLQVVPFLNKASGTELIDTRDEATLENEANEFISASQPNEVCEKLFSLVQTLRAPECIVIASFRMVHVLLKEEEIQPVDSGSIAIAALFLNAKLFGDRRLIQYYFSKTGAREPKHPDNADGSSESFSASQAQEKEKSKNSDKKKAGSMKEEVALAELRILMAIGFEFANFTRFMQMTTNDSVFEKCCRLLGLKDEHRWNVRRQLIDKTMLTSSHLMGLEDHILVCACIYLAAEDKVAIINRIKCKILEVKSTEVKDAVLYCNKLRKVVSHIQKMNEKMFAQTSYDKSATEESSKFRSTSEQMRSESQSSVGRLSATSEPATEEEELTVAMIDTSVCSQKYHHEKYPKEIRLSEYKTQSEEGTCGGGGGGGGGDRGQKRAREHLSERQSAYKHRCNTKSNESNRYVDYRAYDRRRERIDTNARPDPRPAHSDLNNDADSYKYETNFRQASYMYDHDRSYRNYGHSEYHDEYYRSLHTQGPPERHGRERNSRFERDGWDGHGSRSHGRDSDRW